MWIFTTREVSVIIYSIVFLIYVLIKKGKSVFLPVIKVRLFSCLRRHRISSIICDIVETVSGTNYATARL